MIATAPRDTDEAPASLRSLYRVVPRRDSDTPFDGISNRSGGRWTSPGVPAVYASLSPAGAVLEFLVHLDGEKPVDLVLVKAALPEDCLVVAVSLPLHWREFPYRADVRAFGDRWISSRRSLALQVPSALCDEVNNLLLNPDHPDARRIRIVSVDAFTLDPRLLAH